MASAGTIIDENTDSEHPATNKTTATESICPKGWTLPNSSQIRTIGSSGGSTTYLSIFSPVLGGAYGNGALNNKDTRGFWWSSTANDLTYRYSLRYEGSSLYTDSYYRNYGRYIRCVQAS